MPRFIILEHDHPTLHWDLMLEDGDHLRTWKLLEDPSIFLSPKDPTPNISIKAEPSFDHRLIYLDYEGPISNNRGSVKRFDYGIFDWLKQNAIETLINLQGKKIKGPFSLSQSLFIIYKG